MQLYFSGITRDLVPGSESRMPQADPYPAFVMSACNTRPKSTGAIKLSGPNLSDPPAIEFNFLHHADDLQELIEAVRILRAFAAAPALASIIDHEYNPGAQVETDAEIENDIRERAYSIYHPCGTCRMGPDAEDCVVDSRLRVHGLTGLRVADASIFPNIVSGNLNGPCMMVGQRASELLLEEVS